MKVAVFGTGYVGLVTAVGLAEKGISVVCIDVDKNKLDLIKKGISPIYEPGLEELLLKNTDRIETTVDPAGAIRSSDVIIIAVGTPFDGKQIDLCHVREAALEIGTALKNVQDYKLIVVKSTVVPGTTTNFVKPLVLEQSGKSGEDIGFAMNPEFLREGNAVEDFMAPDRIVIGVSSKKDEDILREVYGGFPATDIVVTNPDTAEMIKYTANSFLALTISFANEIARICEKLFEVDSEDVFKGVILDKRFSPVVKEGRVIPEFSTYLRAGIGFGGSCFPKDVKALHSLAESLQIDGKLLSGLLYVNNTQLYHVFNSGLGNHKGKVRQIAVLGTAFKPGTDDIRESPGIALIQLALDKDIKVSVHDYAAIENTEKHFGKEVKYFENPLNAIKDADLIFITTIWPQYKLITDEEFERYLKNDAIVVDARSHYKDRPVRNWRYRVGTGKQI